MCSIRQPILASDDVPWRRANSMARVRDLDQNGILMCSLHHKAFDRGALGLSEDRVILVSQHLHGGPQVRDTLIRFAGMPLSRPKGWRATPDSRAKATAMSTPVARSR